MSEAPVHPRPAAASPVRWILCGGMWRSGSTLQYQIAARLVEAAGVGRRLPYASPAGFDEVAERHEPDPGMLVFKSHECTSGMRDRLDRGEAVAILSHRDPRDVIVSMADKDAITPTAVWAARTAKAAVDRYRSWEGPWPVHETPYEQLRDRTAEEVLAIAKRIGVPCEADVARDIATALEPRRQAARLQAIESTRGWTRAGEGGNQFDPFELLNRGHLADGRSGKWRERLSTEVVSAIESEVGGWMRSHGYPGADA